MDVRREDLSIAHACGLASSDLMDGQPASSDVRFFLVINGLTMYGHAFLFQEKVAAVCCVRSLLQRVASYAMQQCGKSRRKGMCGLT